MFLLRSKFFQAMWFRRPRQSSLMKLSISILDRAHSHFHAAFSQGRKGGGKMQRCWNPRLMEEHFSLEMSVRLFHEVEREVTGLKICDQALKTFQQSKAVLFKNLTAQINHYGINASHILKYYIHKSSTYYICSCHRCFVPIIFLIFWHANTRLKIKGTHQISIEKKKYAGYSFWYGLGNALGTKCCHIIWWKWKLSTYRRLTSNSKWKNDVAG